jgi:hypothetical protein
MPYWFSRPFAVNFTLWRILTDIIGDDFSGLFMDQVHLAQPIKQAVASNFPIYLRVLVISVESFGSVVPPSDNT